MAGKSDYEFECMRADLLGIKRPERAEAINEPVPVGEELVEAKEQLETITGGLDELNILVKSTRKKLTRYQSFSKRFGSIFKKGPNQSGDQEEQKDVISEKHKPNEVEAGAKTTGVSSINFEEVARQTDKLDMMLMKAEHAEINLKENNKIIRKIVRKK